MQAEKAISLTQNVAGIILAAGASRRMGRTKQLLPAGGEILIERVLNETLKSDLNWVVLVLGHHAKEIQSALGQTIRHPKLKVVLNNQYLQGISTSIIAGLTAIEDACDHVMILLGDIPHVDSGLINHLIQQYLDSHLPLGAVKTKGKRSHPVIFNREVYCELHGLRGDVGGRSLLNKYSSRVCLVEPKTPYDDMDIDTPEEYSEFLRGLE